MVQINNSLISRNQLNEALGCTLSEKEFSRLQQQIKQIEPSVGLFWETTKAEAGLYIVVAGKSRLVNQASEKICTFLLVFLNHENATLRHLSLIP